MMNSYRYFSCFVFQTPKLVNLFDILIFINEKSSIINEKGKKQPVSDTRRETDNETGGEIRLVSVDTSAK